MIGLLGQKIIKKVKKIVDAMILNSESVLDAFYYIFNSAELRLLWEGTMKRFCLWMTIKFALIKF